MWLGKAPKVPSDAALHLIEWARGRILRDDWLRVLDDGEIRRAVELIAGAPQPGAAD
jgi:D-apionate oxidoisomerase